jgi:hypothetical protein
MTDQGAEGDALARAEMLLDARRPGDALVLVHRCLLSEPDNQAARLVLVRCQLALGRIDEAERSWTRAVSTQPADPATALVGVMCAVFHSDQLLWERAQRFQSLAPEDPAALFFVAVAAARAGHMDRAESAISRLQHLAADFPLTLYAVAEVDLADAVRTRRRRAHRAEQAAKDLLTRDPLDAYAHDIRIRCGELRRQRGLRQRSAAMSQLDFVRQGAVAGRPPSPSSMLQLTRLAGSPFLLMVVGALLVSLGHRLIDDYSVNWVVAALPLGVSVLLLALPTVRWTRHAARKLPLVSRPTLLRPVIRSYAANGVLAIVVGAVILAVLSPYSEERALQLEFEAGLALLQYWVAAGVCMVLTGLLLLTCMADLRRAGRG